jgi:pyruvate formate lyase activating enzyme
MSAGGLRIGGLQRFSLCDYPGRVAAVVFTQGCNFRCPFCHNGALLPLAADVAALVPEDEVLDFLRARAGRLGAVVVSGGEPTLQPGLPAFLRAVKALGYAVKLDTNGSRPEVLRALLAEGLVDFVAMDVKAPWDVYDRLTGVRAPVEALQRSVALIAASGRPHEFRTTAVGALLSPAELRRVRAQVPVDSPHRLQVFRPETAFAEGLQATPAGYDRAALDALARAVTA